MLHSFKRIGLCAFSLFVSTQLSAALQIQQLKVPEIEQSLGNLYLVTDSKMDLDQNQILQELSYQPLESGQEQTLMQKVLNKLSLDGAFGSTDIVSALTSPRAIKKAIKDHWRVDGDSTEQTDFRILFQNKKDQLFFVHLNSKTKVEDYGNVGNSAISKKIASQFAFLFPKQIHYDKNPTKSFVRTNSKKKNAKKIMESEATQEILEKNNRATQVPSFGQNLSTKAIWLDFSLLLQYEAHSSTLQLYNTFKDSAITYTVDKNNPLHRKILSVQTLEEGSNKFVVMYETRKLNSRVGLFLEIMDFDNQQFRSLQKLEITDPYMTYYKDISVEKNELGQTETILLGASNVIRAISLNENEMVGLTPHYYLEEAFDSKKVSTIFLPKSKGVLRTSYTSNDLYKYNPIFNAQHQLTGEKKLKFFIGFKGDYRNSHLISDDGRFLLLSLGDSRAPLHYIYDLDTANPTLKYVADQGAGFAPKNQTPLNFIQELGIHENIVITKRLLGIYDGYLYMTFGKRDHAASTTVYYLVRKNLKDLEDQSEVIGAFETLVENIALNPDNDTLAVTLSRETLIIDIDHR